MNFYFTDRKFNLLGIASTSTEAPITMADDEDILSIKSSARLIKGTLLFDDQIRDQVETMAALGNYVLYHDEDGADIFTTIMEIEHDPKAREHYFVAEDAGMDLINGVVSSYKADKAYSFVDYFKRFAGDSGFEIGINEISNLTRKLEWESEEQTVLERLLSVATQFDNAEMSFGFEVRGTKVIKRFLNIVKKRGADNRITLYMNRDIDNIRTKGDIYNLATAIKGVGGGDPAVTLKGYNYSDPDGRFVLDKSTGVMKDTVSNLTWSRLLSNENAAPTAGYIERVKTYQTENQKTLCDSVIRELTKVSQPAINYETTIAKLPDNVKIGDTVYLVDEDERLYLSARVLELTRRYSSEEYLATLGDYLIQEDGISATLKELAEQFKQATVYLWIRYADDQEGHGISASPSGKSFIALKSVRGVETPSDNPEDYDGLWTKYTGEDGIPGPPGEDGKPKYTWIKYADNNQGSGMSDNPTGKYYMGIAENKDTLTESTDPADYKWSLVKGDDGKPAHIFQAYAWGPSGERFTINYPTTITDFDYPTYLGTYTTFDAVQSTNPADYTWARMLGETGQPGAPGPTGNPGPPGEPGPPGLDGIAYAQPTEPDTTQEGATWFQTQSDEDTTVIGIYRYTSSQWVKTPVAPGALSVESLSALSANLGEVTAGKIDGVLINGSKFTNTTSYSETGGLVDYTTTIEGNITMDWKAQNSEANGLFTIMPTIMQNDFYGDTAKKNRIGTWTLGSSGLIVGQGNAGVSSFKGAAIGPNGLGMTDPQYAPTYGEVNLTYQDLLTLPTIVIPAASGWSPYATSGGNRPTATRNGRLVQLAGAFKNNAEIGDGGDIARIMGNLPVGYRPASYVKFIVQASVERIYLLTVEVDGRVTLARHRGWDGSKFGYYKVPAGSWLNIACCYTAADI